MMRTLVAFVLWSLVLISPAWAEALRYLLVYESLKPECRYGDSVIIQCLETRNRYQQEMRWTETIEEALAALSTLELTQHERPKLYRIEAEIPLQVQKIERQEPQPPKTVTEYQWSVQE